MNNGGIFKDMIPLSWIIRIAKLTSFGRPSNHVKTTHSELLAARNAKNLIARGGNIQSIFCHKFVISFRTRCILSYSRTVIRRTLTAVRGHALLPRQTQGLSEKAREFFAVVAIADV